jgi:hypothetical protein
MNKFITNYTELNGDENSTSIFDCDFAKEHPQKEQILKYLQDWLDGSLRCSVICDKVTNSLPRENGEFIQIYDHDDGEFLWDDEEVYHFEKYNVELNPEFVEKILKG